MCIITAIFIPITCLQAQRPEDMLCLNVDSWPLLIPTVTIWHTRFQLQLKYWNYCQTGRIVELAALPREAARLILTKKEKKSKVCIVLYLSSWIIKLRISCASVIFTDGECFSFLPASQACSQHVSLSCFIS